MSESPLPWRVISGWIVVDAAGKKVFDSDGVSDDTRDRILEAMEIAATADAPPATKTAPAPKKAAPVAAPTEAPPAPPPPAKVVEDRDLCAFCAKPLGDAAFRIVDGRSFHDPICLGAASQTSEPPAGGRRNRRQAVS